MRAVVVQLIRDERVARDEHIARNRQMPQVDHGTAVSRPIPIKHSDIAVLDGSDHLQTAIVIVP